MFGEQTDQPDHFQHSRMNHVVKPVQFHSAWHKYFHWSKALVFVVFNTTVVVFLFNTLLVVAVIVVQGAGLQRINRKLKINLYVINHLKLTILNWNLFIL